MNGCEGRPGGGTGRALRTCDSEIPSFSVVIYVTPGLLSIYNTITGGGMFRRRSDLDPFDYAQDACGDCGLGSSYRVLRCEWGAWACRKSSRGETAPWGRGYRAPSAKQMGRWEGATSEGVGIRGFVLRIASCACREKRRVG